MSRTRFAIAALGLSALAGCLDIPPEGTDAEMIAEYDAAVASLGCTLTSDADYGAVEFQAGITRAQAVSISEYKLAREEAVRLENGGIRLISGSCAT